MLLLLQPQHQALILENIYSIKMQDYCSLIFKNALLPFVVRLLD